MSIDDFDAYMERELDALKARLATTPPPRAPWLDDESVDAGATQPIDQGDDE